MALETSRFHWFWLSQVFATLDSLFGLNFDRFLEFGAWWSLHGSIWLETREMFLWSRLAGEMWFYHCWFDENTKRCATLTGCDVKLCWRWLCRSRCLAWWNGRNGHFQSFQIRLLRCFRFRCPTWWRMVETYLQQSEATTSDELFFLMFGMGYEGVHLYKGYFKDTVPAFYHKRKGTSFKIAVLRLDCQFHWCLSRLFVLFLWICTCWWLRHFWWLLPCRWHANCLAGVQDGLWDHWRDYFDRWCGSIFQKDERSQGGLFQDARTARCKHRMEKMDTGAASVFLMMFFHCKGGAHAAIFCMFFSFASKVFQGSKRCLTTALNATLIRMKHVQRQEVQQVQCWKMGVQWNSWANGFL